MTSQDGRFGPPLRRAVVLGAGVMGAQIAAHLANVGVPTDLLDIVPRAPSPEETARGLGLGDREVRDRLARGAVKRLLELKPSPLFGPELASRIRPGNLEDDLDRVREADWVIEAIVEDLEAKRALWARVEPLLPPTAVASTNTSGLPIREISAGFGDGLARRFLGTHFFNPPRYLPLVEVVPGPRTSAAAVEWVRRVLALRLGKDVVLAKDTPNFIANRVGTYGLQVALAEMERMGLSVDEVDAVTGPAMGRPRSATFRTLDVVGLDTYAHVAENLRERVADPEERDLFRLPAPVQAMLARGWTGQKAGAGFYRRRRDAGGEVVETLDLATLEYRPRTRPRFESVGRALREPDPARRLRVLLSGDDRAAAFAWAVTARLFAYAARILPEIADDTDAVDRAMRGGFGWALGPFEAWDELGFRETAERMKADGIALPEWVEGRLSEGAATVRGRVVAEGGRTTVVPLAVGSTDEDDLARPARLRRTRGRWSTPDATFAEIGDGVALLLLHGEKDALGPGSADALLRAMDEVEASYRGLVVSGAGENFCVGANLLMMLMAARQGAWDEVTKAVAGFQAATQRMKRFPKPLVVAVHGLALGGGAELVLHAPAVQAAAESYIGLVETGVGLIPGGGGTKELWLRALASVPRAARLDLFPLVDWTFETIALAKVGGSARESAALGFLRPQDGVSRSRERLLRDAKDRVVRMDEAGYEPYLPAPVPVAGREGRARLALAIDEMWRAGRITDHDRTVARALARVLTGGDRPAGALVAEEELLELEREAFCELLARPETQARMAHMLETGRPLRN
ncbi:MAG: 3-hydroxyacyl-CoA dehydrogenase/enoyl-CoA hydratase family protein [Clostridia bacterium]|nr:3-hydroxyacyl-CoA dehydrogenase/enoyl-CoA hydratase family protein [Clostridia bacterium]